MTNIEAKSVRVGDKVRCKPSSKRYFELQVLKKGTYRLDHIFTIVKVGVKSDMFFRIDAGRTSYGIGGIENWDLLPRNYFDEGLFVI